VRVLTAAGEPLALAAYSPHSQIRARVWSFDPGATIDAAFMAERVHAAVAYRRRSFAQLPEACRLVHGENDALPGLIVDLHVKAGDSVNPGDALLILEAMKMENLIKASAQSVVKSVRVKKGDSVEKNQVLIEF
jgi:biotin carboxyl carrier protein